MKKKFGIAKLGFMGKLAAMLVTGAMAACPALAQDVSTWDELISAVKAAENAEQTVITLKADMVADETMRVAGEKYYWPDNYESTYDIILDLNGYEITRAEDADISVIEVGSNASLVIRDSQASAPSSVKHNVNVARDTNPVDGTGIALPSTFNDETNVLTWYETRSEKAYAAYPGVSGVNVQTTTKETRYKSTVTVKGAINGNGGSKPIISLTSSYFGTGGKLKIEGGAFYGSDNRAIENAGSNMRCTLDIAGGYFFNNESAENGGAVYVSNADLSIGKGTDANGNTTTPVFAGNSTSNRGGAIYIGNDDCVISGGIFSGNSVTKADNHVGGGAIYVAGGAKVTMTDGLITNNWGVANAAGQTHYQSHGGGVWTRGQFKMTGGQITANEAAGGGGVATEHADGGVFIMTDGIIAGNVARMNEGGGVAITYSGKGNIIGGYITNNACETKEHWGGGGLFISDNAVCTMRSLLVTNNHAEGFGGGGTGCPTGRIDTHGASQIQIRDHSIALFNNSAAGKLEGLSGDGSTKPEDHRYAYIDEVFNRPGKYYQDYFSALTSTFCCGMLGGGKANWIGTIDGEVFDCQQHDHPADNVRANSSQHIVGLTSRPAVADQKAALDKATVYMTGNTSNTHGGGFLCDGYLMVGTDNEIEVGDRMMVKGVKTLEGGKMTEGQFTFKIADMQRLDSNNQPTVIATGKNTADGAIEFDHRLTFDKAGTYSYKIYEVAGSNSSITYDDEVYTLTVTVTSSTSTKEGVDENGNIVYLTVKFNKISHVKLTDSEGTVIFNRDMDSSDNNALEFGDPEISFTNSEVEEEKGGLTVSKSVVSSLASDKEREFYFTVKLDDDSITGIFGGMTFFNGVASFILADGETKTAAGLPVGVGYTVTEDSETNFTTTSTGTTGDIVANQTKTSEFVNTRKTGDLTVSKKLVSDAAADKDQTFTFTVTLDDTSIAGTFGDMTFTAGVATVTLKGGESATAEDLPVGVGYSVTEAKDNNFTATSAGATGTITTNGAEAAFTNTRKTGGLQVTKTVVGNFLDKLKSFDFVVTLDDTTINGKYGDMSFKNGVAKFSLKDGDKKSATGLPSGIGYTVEETNGQGYTTEYSGETSGDIKANETITVAFTNSRFYGDLVVSKILVSDAAADKNQEFTFTVTLSDKTVSGEFSDMTFENGVATFMLKGGSKATAVGLPDGVSYEVVEVAADGYTTTATGAKGTIDKDKGAAAVFTNKRNTGNLKVAKTVTGNDSDTTKAFSFTVTLSDKTISGKHGDMTFNKGVATFTLKHGETKTATDLPAGIGYTVTEVSDGYTTSATNATGTISDGQTITATFTNDKSRELLGNLAVKKVVTGNDSDTTKAFSFTIELSDKTVSGKHGDMTFNKGVATFTLKHGETKTATDLPHGATYTVTEVSDGYTSSATNATGTISDGKTITATFTNDKSRELLGSLKVSKNVAGNAGDKTKAFAFKVTLDEPLNGKYGDMTFSNGVANFSLKHGQFVTASNLPAGTIYTVVEMLDDAAYVVTATGASGTIRDMMTVEAAFTNTKNEEAKYGDLRVEKFVKGNAADKTKKFTFIVTLSDASINGKYGDMTFKNGIATIKLADRETAVAKKLPAGISYSVVEEDSEDYAVGATNEKGKVFAGNATIVTFVNTRHVADMPTTGDNSSLALYTALLAISGAALLILVRRKSRA